jgi:hypothetical protein
VQTALNSAASGDTVKCSVGGTYSWGNVSIPATKNITLDGNGATITGSITIPSSASYTARITNFTFRTSVNAITTSGDNITNKPWRIDHCTFNPSDSNTYQMIQTYSGPGLIDHCKFINIPVAKETIHNMGWGPGSLTGWQNVLTPGSPNALYLEDNTITAAQGNSSCLIQNYYGARSVIRHNTFNSAMADNHGNHTPYSGRWWEWYDNTLTNGSLLCLRGGSGLVFNNTGGQAFFINETSTDYGIGDGQNMSYYPAYTWGNSGMSLVYNSEGCSIQNGSVAVGTDIIGASSGTTLPGTCTASPPQGFWKTDTNTLYKCTATNTWTAYYTPYTYPHPLTNNVVTDTVKPNPPMAVIVY